MKHILNKNQYYIDFAKGKISESKIKEYHEIIVSNSIVIYDMFEHLGYKAYNVKDNDYTIIIDIHNKFPNISNETVIDVLKKVGIIIENDSKIQINCINVTIEKLDEQDLVSAVYLIDEVLRACNDLYINDIAEAKYKEIIEKVKKEVEDLIKDKNSYANEH